MNTAAAASTRSRPTPSRRARAAVPRRRTQAERRAVTRARLLEAALEALVEHGYAGFTTTVVGKNAGLSQGALFLHFPTKSALLAATIEHLFLDMVSAYEKRFARLDGARDRLTSALELLWDVFQDPRLLAAFELFTASRTDPELRASLAPVLAQHGENLRAVAAALLPEAAAQPERFELCVGLVMMAMQGMALSSIVEPESDRARPAIPFLTEAYHRLLAPAAPRPRR